MASLPDVDPSRDVPVPDRRRTTRRSISRRIFTRIVVYSVSITIILFILGVTGCMEKLAFHPTRNTPPPPPGHNIREVFFKSDDGTKLHAWFAPAVEFIDRPANAKATVLVVHGNAGNISDHFGFVEFLPEYGYNVFIFDYRGFGNSDTGRLRRHEFMKDTEAAIATLRADPELGREIQIDPDRIVLYAQSIGTTFGSHLMLNHPEIRAGIFISPITAWRDITASVLAFGRPDPNFIARGLARILMPAGLDPIDAIPQITDRPVLLVHGSADEVVPLEHSKKILDAAIANGAVQMRLREVPGGDHNSLRWLDSTLDNDLVRFFDDALNMTENQ